VVQGAETTNSELTNLELLADATPQAQIELQQAKLVRLERRDWWLWIVALFVMTLLTGAVVSMSFPGLIAERDPLLQQSMDRAVRGLVGLVLLFNVYSVYQQVMIKRTRRQLSQQLDRAKQDLKDVMTDPLTNLSNRRTIDEFLKREMGRSRRRKCALTVVAFDLNNFKQINDRYGHSAGDLVLRAFAQKLQYRRRIEDMAVRMGGDEFLLVLPECHTEQVPMLLERLRPCEVEFQGIRFPVEFSSGAASYDGTETATQLLERADKALYADKRARKAGRQLEAVVA
jgi:diguanylate cyclase (GGDEF)-like protein